ncbi:MAG TPA: hypothetical protein VHI10_08050 [Mycobacterium sp.]|nr:hypothetical protein [Mycobacterium sp.]
MSNTRRLAAPFLFAWAIIGAATGCSSSPPAEQPSTSVSPTGHGSLAQCLSEHGVPAAPGPAVGPPPGVSEETWNRAMQECSSLAPGPAG